MNALNKLNDLLNSPHLGVALLDTKDLANFFYRMNDTLKKFYQYDEKEINRLNLMDVEHSKNMAEILEKGYQMIRGEASDYTAHRKFVRKDNTTFWAMISVSKISERFLLYIVEDISGIKSFQGNIDDILEPHGDDEINIFVKQLRNIEPNELKGLQDRKFFRLELKHPICAAFKTVDPLFKMLPSKVCIKDIGPGGLQFHTDVNLDLKEDTEIELSFRLLSQQYKVTGIIVRHTRRHHINHYGLKYTLTPSQIDHLTGTLHNLSILLKNNIKIYDTDICDRPCHIR